MKDNKNTHKKFKLLLIIFAIIGIIFVKEENQQKAINIFNSFKSIDKDLKLSSELEVIENGRFYYFNNSIIKWDENIITFLNSDGSNLWTKEFSFIEPEISIKGENLYVMDKSTGDIYLLDNKGNTVSRINLNTSIFNLKEDNNFILVHIKEESGEKLKIIGKDGKEILSQQINHILTYSIDKANKYLISNLKMDGGDIGSNLNIFSTEGEAETIPFKNEIIIFSQIINNRIILLTDKSLNIIEDNNIIWSENFPLVKDILIDRDKIYLLYGDNLEIINIKGEKEKKITFGLDYKSMVPIGKYIVIYGERDILVLQEGDEVIKYKTDEGIMNINGNNNSIAIIYLNKLEIYDIINKE